MAHKVVAKRGWYAKDETSGVSSVLAVLVEVSPPEPPFYKVYIGGTNGHSWDAEAPAIAGHGTRVPQNIAQVLFPWVPEDRWYD